MIPGVSIPTTGKLAALFRVPINYVLEWRVNGVIIASISTPNTPIGISFERTAATDLQFTLDDDPIIERSENKSAMIQLRGTSGQRARAGYNEAGQVIFADGPSILREFDRFLDNYQTQAAVLRDIATVELVFRALDEDAHYKVELGTWNWSRDALRSRTMVDWILTLRGYARAEPVIPLNLLSPVSDLFEAAAAKIDLANAYLAVASNAVTNTRSDLESIRAPLLAVQRTAQALGAVASSARSLAAFPRDLMADLASVAGELRNAWEEARGAISLLDPTVGGALRAEWDNLTREIGFAVEDANRDALTSLGYSGGGGLDLIQAGLRDGENREGLPLLPQSAAITLAPGEDLRDLARRLYGDPDRWTEIAALNGWTSPYRDSQGVLVHPGMSVLVPLTAVDQISTADKERLGRDLYLSAAGELDWSSGDLRTIRGPDNFEQALRNRSFTIQGEIPVFPLYGLPEFVGNPLTGSMRGLVASHVSEQFKRDQRVASIASLEIQDLGDRFVIDAELTPSEGPPFRVTLPL